MSAITLAPSPGASHLHKVRVALRGFLSRRTLMRLAGIEAVVLEGECFAVRPVPLGIARELVPAIVRCSRQFAEWKIDETLYDDMVIVLSRGLGTSPARIERLTVPLWDLAPVLDKIARVNGLPVMEAGPQGKLLATLMKSIGTSSTLSSSASPDGPGNTSTST